MTDQIDMPQIAQRLFGAPLMIEPNKAAVIAEAFGPRILGGGSVTIVGASTDGSRGGQPRPMTSVLGEEMAEVLSEQRTGYGKHRGIAIVPVTGSLVRRGAFLGNSSGMTSYEGLAAQIKAAAADPEMRAIALEIDSPGGEAAGAFEMARVVAEARQAKPVYAFLADDAMSAAYAIACQCDRVFVPEFGGAGSIGVIAIHVDQSGALAKDGLKVSIIRSGDRKAQGNAMEPLPDDLRQEWQRISDAMRVKFAQLVEAGRGGRMTVARALETEGAVFTGRDAVEIGLADEVADPKQAFDALVDDVAKNAPRPVPAARAASASATPSEPDVQTLARDWAAANVEELRGLAALIRGPGHANGGSAPIHREASMSADQKTRPGAENPGTETRATLQLQAAAAEPKAPATDTATAALPARETDASGDGGVAAERERTTRILAAASKAGVSTTFAQQLIASGADLATAMGKIIDAAAESGADGGEMWSGGSTARVTADGTDRMREGMVKALSLKAGLEGGERNEFTGMSLREMARETLRQRGLSAPPGGAMVMVGAAFAPSMAGGMHSTSDFGSILADVANKSMLRGYQEAPETFPRFTRSGTLSDFKPSKRVGLDLFPSLTKIEDGAEFTFGSMKDYAESIVLATYGRLFAITRQTVINDDLGAFTDVPMKMGRAARRTIGDLVYAVLSANGNMSDGTALFHADHGNLAASGAGPSEVTINAGITAMATQKGRGKEATALNISPRFLIAPPKWRSAVLQALNSEYAPDDTDKAGSTKMSRAFNTVRAAAEPIFDARITGDSWYLAADPAAFDTIEVAYLDGQTEPFLDQQDGWRVDGTEFKVRIDAGVAPMAWEGLYKNPGS